LLDAAPVSAPLRAAAQFGSESWQVSELLPAMTMAPFSFAWNRIANGTTVVPAAGCGEKTTTAHETATMMTAPRTRVTRRTSSCTQRDAT